MTRPSVVHLSGLVVLAALAGGGVLPSPAQAETPLCDGKPATIVGTEPGEPIHGTPGDDVVVVVPERGSWSEDMIQTYEGDDTICLVPGTGPVSPDASPPFFVVRTGPGDDTVLQQEPREVGLPAIELGPGSDTFVGTGRAEFVTAGESAQGGPLGPDDAKDVISTGGGWDHVTSGSPGDVNKDVISTGAGHDTITLGGFGAALDNGERGLGDELELVGDGWKQRLVTLDNRARIGTADDGKFLRWSNVLIFDVRGESPVRFVGSGARESVELTSTLPIERRGSAPVDVSLGGGDDNVWLHGILEGRLDGGAGQDSMDPPHHDECARLVATLNASMSCTAAGTAAPVSYRVALSGLETYTFYARHHASITGTAGPDSILVDAARIVARGLGGDDTIRVWSRGNPSVLHGDEGDDRLIGGEGRDLLSGGTGHDVMRGKAGRDRLRGGAGTDTARGGEGVDRCVAEERRACEKP